MRRVRPLPLALVLFAGCAVEPGDAALRGLSSLVVHVDAAAAAGGDGSASRPFRTIEEGIAGLPSAGGTVLIEPGTYLGPIVIDRDRVVLRGNTTPLYDDAGFLRGFTREVVVTPGRKLLPEDLIAGRDVEDVVELRGSDDEVHNLVAELRGDGFTPLGAAFSAKAEDDEFYENVVFADLLVRGKVDTAVNTRKANARIERVTSLEPGYLGANAIANGTVTIEKVHFAHKGIGACLFSLWEYPGEENGPSRLNVTVRDSYVHDGNGVLGFSGKSMGFLVIGRAGPRTNPYETMQIDVDATGNTLESLHHGVVIWADEFGLGQRSNTIAARFAGNAYARNRDDADVRFETYRPSMSGPAEYARNSTITVEDRDGVFPAPGEVPLGPAENGNLYLAP